MLIYAVKVLQNLIRSYTIARQVFRGSLRCMYKVSSMLCSWVIIFLRLCPHRQSKVYYSEMGHCVVVISQIITYFSLDFYLYFLWVGITGLYVLSIITALLGFNEKHKLITAYCTNKNFHIITAITWWWIIFFIEIK